MKTHLTEEEVYDLAYDKLDISNIKVDKTEELAQLLDLEYDEDKGAYLDPDFLNPKQFLKNKYKHDPNSENGKFGFNEVISIIEEYINTYN